MIIIHIESGLGNQMLSYCELLALRKVNQDDDFYIETIVFDIPECNDTICQWNGYELEKVFGKSIPNIKVLFSEKEWAKIIEEVKDSRFWEKQWNYPVYITQVLNNHGFTLKNVRGDFEVQSNFSILQRGFIGKLRTSFFNKTKLGNFLRRIITEKCYPENYEHPSKRMLFLRTTEDIFTGQRLTFKLRGTEIDNIHDEIMETFVFPPFSTEKNQEFAKMLDGCNSVFIHARRGDMLSANGWCYKYGYFRRAVKYIKKHVENPVFVFFTNTGSIDWCKENARTFALDYSKDKVLFVDWNSGEESFRDMQLMTHCKHGIITNSTFGWWGAYLIQNPNKITISPLAEINTTYHC